MKPKNPISVQMELSNLEKDDDLELKELKKNK